jgi:hypothetical protein
LTPFPGFYALLPVGGALLVLLYGGESTLVARVLSRRPLVGLGLISYSAYLWHQPLFAFARLRLDGFPEASLMILLTIVTLLLAIVSYRWVEKPFREKGRIRPRVLVSMAVVSTVTLGLLGFVGAHGDGFRDRWEPGISLMQWTSLGDRQAQEGKVCEGYLDPKYPSLQFCEYGNLDAIETLVVYGDSHLDSISYQLDSVSANRGIRIVQAEIPGCGIIPEITRRSTDSLKDHYKRCDEGFRQLLEFIEDRRAKVLVVSRWTFQMFPAPGHVEALNFDNGVGGVESISYRENVAVFSDGSSTVEWEAKKVATTRLLEGLADSADEIYVNYPIPEMGWDIFKENLRNSRTQGQLASLKYPAHTYYARNDSVIGILEEVATSRPNVHLIRADIAFCSDIVPEYCVAQTADSIFYLDDDHLSDAGADLFLDKIPLFRSPSGTEGK